MRFKRVNKQIIFIEVGQMSFLDSIMSLFGGGNKGGQQQKGGVQAAAQHQKVSKQVYEGSTRTTARPDWAEGLNNTQLAEEMSKHVVCRYSPNFGLKKIMSTTVGPDGNLLPEYEGVAGDCGAVKNFGMVIAKRDGLLMPYRYVDVNLAFKACCENPKRCPFFLSAQGEAANMTSKMRKI